MNVQEKESIADIVATLIMDYDGTYAELAKEIQKHGGTSTNESSISQWKNKARFPSTQSLYGIARTFGYKTPSDMLFKNQPPPPPNKPIRGELWISESEEVEETSTEELIGIVETILSALRVRANRQVTIDQVPPDVKDQIFREKLKELDELSKKGHQ